MLAPVRHGTLVRSSCSDGGHCPDSVTTGAEGKPKVAVEGDRLPPCPFANGNNERRPQSEEAGWGEGPWWLTEALGLHWDGRRGRSPCFVCLPARGWHLNPGSALLVPLAIQCISHASWDRRRRRRSRRRGAGGAGGAGGNIMVYRCMSHPPEFEQEVDKTG